MSTDDRVEVTTGIARLHASPGLAGTGRLGLVTNRTGVLPDLRSATPALIEAGARLVALFGTERGLHGTGQAGESEAAQADPTTGLPAHDTYDLMVSAARTDVRFVVADRSNPLGGLVSEGPLLDPGWAGFVGRAPIPFRHGLTRGELARRLNASVVPQGAGTAVDLTVVETVGRRRAMDAEATGLPPRTVLGVPPLP
ncbi:exo-beta-N-acetylmuramidase NamZ domain-containing protein [Streptomyces sp. NPDC001315]|uniref:exo-beta-N-acetylmuramidase NamZ domain-containing protein n=1 Tax=Streptomyces sp. NPDC001315 TaxID=3364562 RepID=UPI0036868DDE